MSSFLLPAAPDLDQFTHELGSGAHTDYAGFNLVLFSPSSKTGGSISYKGSLVTNSGGGGDISSRDLNADEALIGAISNGVESIDGKDWPKVKRGQTCLSQILDKDHLESSEGDLVNQLFDMLT